MNEENNLEAVEGIKDRSNYLRGGLVKGLQNNITGSIEEDDTQLTKYHGIYMQDDRDLRTERSKQKSEPFYSFMVRIRVPGGVATPEQWLAADRIANSHANGTLKLTTRQAFQWHGVVKRKLKSSIAQIIKADMDTLAACGDVNRNVMSSVNPYQSPAHAEVIDWAAKLSDHLTPRTTSYCEIWVDGEKIKDAKFNTDLDDGDEEPIYGKTYLPRKFKASMAIPPNNDPDIYSQDLGFIAIVEDEKLKGFTVTCGGGFGTTHNVKETYPRLATPICFIKPEDTLKYAEEIVKIQRDFGDRTNRKHARFKYTIDDRGVDWLKEELSSRLGEPLAEPREVTFTRNGDQYGWLKGTDEKWHYTAYIEGGRVKDTEDFPMMTGLREIAKILKGEFRLTGNQNVIISGVAEADKPAIEALLVEYKLKDSTNQGGLRLNSISCVALPTCGLAMAEAERYLPKLINKIEVIFEENGLKDEEVIIRMTGCPNGCGRPFLGEIAFIGKSLGRYNMYLGASFNGDRLNKLYRESIDEKQILEELKPIVKRYAEEKTDGEYFGDFVIRAGIIKATVEGKDFHDHTENA